MPNETADTCIDPAVGHLLGDAISGALRPEARDEDRKRFERHMKHCRKCRKALIDHLNEAVTIPALRQFAEENGISFEDVCEAFRYGLQKTRESGE